MIDGHSKREPKVESFQDIQKYFIRSEGNTVLSGDWHGTDGPLEFRICKIHKR